MSDIAAVLKKEIQRLARKEVKTQMLKTRRATVRYRSDIAKLKRALQLQDRKIAQLEARKSEDSAPEPAGEEAASGLRFSARSVRAQRKRLKLTAEQFARLIGVSPQTVYLWERGKVRPKQAQFAALVSARTLGRREVLARLGNKPQKAARRSRPARRTRTK
jgi:DNA-binding transcriptional regulator YiaG